MYIYTRFKQKETKPYWLSNLNRYYTIAQKAMEEEVESGNIEELSRSKLEAPTTGNMKCNVGVKWSKQKKLLGASWVLRNCRGETLLHSRRAFVKVDSYLDAKFLSLMWAIESMWSRHVERVIFETDFADLVGAVLRQKDWPALRYQSSELRKAVSVFQVWNFRVVPSHANKCAQAIATSATRERWLQSYVAKGKSSLAGGNI